MKSHGELYVQICVFFVIMQQPNEFESHIGMFESDTGMFDRYMLFLIIRSVKTKNAAETENDSII